MALCVVLPEDSRGDAFDRYLHPILAKAPGQDGVREIQSLTPEFITDHARVLPQASGAFLIVKTNEGRFSKLLVQAALQRLNDEKRTAVPILLIERFVTYREGQERAVQAQGQNVYLFDGFRFSLDLGQVVPESFGGDMRWMVKDKKRTWLEPAGKARLYLAAKPLPGAEPKKGARLKIGDVFETRYFNGSYKLFDDGRRSGTLQLTASAEGEVSGSYYSDKDGQKYEVFGKIGSPKHAVQFTIKFPRAEQVFQGMLFTGDGKALTGTSRLADRDAGFYALRLDEE